MANNTSNVSQAQQRLFFVVLQVDIGLTRWESPRGQGVSPLDPPPAEKPFTKNNRSKQSEQKGLLLLSTNEITFPVLPPTFFRVLPRPWAAFVRAGPADADTRVRPSVALAAADEAVWLALVAASEADEACLTVVLRVKACCDCRRATARETATGILTSDCEWLWGIYAKGKMTGRRQRRERVAEGDSRVQLTGWFERFAQRLKSRK